MAGRRGTAALYLLAVCSLRTAPVVAGRPTHPPPTPRTVSLTSPTGKPAHPGVNGGAAEDRALAWAERRLASLPDRMPQAGESPSWAILLLEARGNFEAIAARYGPSARAWRDLGACDLRLGEYEKAVQEFRSALGLQPSDRVASAGLHKTATLFAVGQAITPLLPPNRRIIQIRPYPKPAPGQSWLVLEAEVTGADPNAPPHHLKGPLTLALFVKEGGQFRRGWSVDDREGAGGLWDAYVYDAQVYVQDLAGTGIPQVVFHETFPGGSVEPSHLAIYAWKADRLIRVLNLQSTAPFWLSDREHNGTGQVWMSREIGFTMAHVAQPRWTDVYAWSNGRFRLADKRYPGAFRHWVEDLQDTLAEHPGDADILAHLGATYEILGRQRDADRTYQLAERQVAKGSQDWFSLLDFARAYRAGGREQRAVAYYQRAIRACEQAAAREKEAGERAYDTQQARDVRDEMLEGST